MQAYEHILTSFIYINTQDKSIALEHLKKYAAYYTYSDSVRGAVGLTYKTEEGKAKPYRQPSHFSDGAGMKFIIGDELKEKCAEGYPEDHIVIPEGGLELKAADGKTQLNEVKKLNPDILKTKQGCAILLHLTQDTISDDLFQSEIATCYVDDELGGNNDSVNLYGVETKNGLARFNKTGNVDSMDKFRKVVSLVQKLSTLELFRKVKQKFPDLTFGEIQEAVNASYDSEYPECMKNAKKYSVPSMEEQEEILHAVESGELSNSPYYRKIKEELVELKAFNNIDEIDITVRKFIDKVSNLRNQNKDFIIE